jgi:hypothetical protein
MDYGYDFGDQREVSRDPHLIDRFECDYDMYDYWRNEPLDRSDEIEDLRSLTEKLSERDQWLYKALYIQGLTQEDAGKVIGLKQSAVSTAKETIESRLRVLASLPRVSWKPVFRCLTPSYSEILKIYLRTASQTLTAETISIENFTITQGQVRSALRQIVSRCDTNGMDEAVSYLNILMSDGKVLHNRR